MEVDQIELDEAKAALWRIQPNTFVIPCELNNFAKPDPFEGPGETYHDAYNRVLSELRVLQVTVGMPITTC